MCVNMCACPYMCVSACLYACVCMYVFLHSSVVTDRATLIGKDGAVCSLLVRVEGKNNRAELKER